MGEGYVQLKLNLEFSEVEYKRLPRKLKKKKKRIRYKIPTYIKFYSIYQYDRLLFRELMNKWLASKEGKNRTLKSLRETQNRILDVCYVRDEEGKPLRDCDEKHIYRYATLQKICEKIYNLGHNKAGNYSCLVFFDDEQQAQIKGTDRLPVSQRVKIHIKLLREIGGLSKVDRSRL